MNEFYQKPIQFEPFQDQLKMAWTPSAQGLEELLQCLRNSSASDNAIQQAVQKVSYLCCDDHLQSL